MLDSTASLVERVNLIYHELEAGRYAQAHAEIYRGERRRWTRLLRWATAGRVEPPRILDLAAGAGFVAEIAREAEIPFRQFTLSDLSPRMLEVAKKRLGGPADGKNFEFKTAPADHTGAEPESLDIITANSALHHFPRLGPVFGEVKRTLKPGGVFIVAHEPNLHFWDDDGPARLAEAWKRRIYFLKVYANPWRYLRRALQAIGLAAPRRREPTLEALTAQECARLGLRLEGREIEARDVPGLVDCLVPGNHPAGGGGHDTDSPDGLDPFDLGPKWFPGWRVEQFEIYDYLGDLAHGAPWLRGLEKRLARRNPDQGCHFCLALIKPEA